MFEKGAQCPDLKIGCSEWGWGSQETMRDSKEHLYNGSRQSPGQTLGVSIATSWNKSCRLIFMPEV